ncbi:MAG: ABC transporter substrate-binding protein [Thermotogota bacterium]
MKKFLLTLFVMLAVVSVFSFSIVDDLGRVVEIEEVPQRVVVAAPAFTDYLIRLGVSDKIVGVTEYDMFDAEKIGQLTPLNIEKIVSLKPDIVIVAGGFQAPETYKLEKFDLTVVCFNPNNVDTIFRTMKIFATIFDVEEKGKQLVNEANERLLSISRDKSYKIPVDERKSIFYAMISGNEIKDLWTCGQGSFLNEMISLAGGVNITGNYSGANGWLPISVEFVASKNPDVILVPYYYEGGEEASKEVIQDFSPWKDINAVKDQTIYGIDGNKASYANFDLLDLLEEIYSHLYGEIKN